MIFITIAYTLLHRNYLLLLLLMLIGGTMQGHTFDDDEKEASLMRIGEDD